MALLARVAAFISGYHWRSTCGLATRQLVRLVFRAMGLWTYRGVFTDRLQNTVAYAEFRCAIGACQWARVASVL